MPLWMPRIVSTLKQLGNGSLSIAAALGRCSGHGMKAVEQAFSAADILIQNGGFGMIALDLGNVEERLIRKIPLTSWFRFARVMEKCRPRWSYC